MASNYRKNHEPVWQGVASELAKNPGAFTESQIEQATRYANSDIHTRDRHYRDSPHNPIISAINYAEMDSLSRFRSNDGCHTRSEKTPEDRLRKAVDDS